MIYPNLGTSDPDSNFRLFSAGTYSWVKPVGASMIYFEVAGAGGGGGGGYASADGGAGGGGVGGSGFIYMAPALFVPDILQFTVGQGGAGGTPGSPGTSGSTGGSTTITYPRTNQTLITCLGGTGGTAGAAAADGTYGAVVSAPDIKYFASFGILSTFAGGASVLPRGTGPTLCTVGGGPGSGVALGADMEIPMTAGILPVGVNGTDGGSATLLTSPFLRGTGGNGGGRGSSGVYAAGNGGNGVLGNGGGGGGGWAISGGGFGGKGGDGYICIGFY